MKTLLTLTLLLCLLAAQAQTPGKLIFSEAGKVTAAPNKIGSKASAKAQQRADKQAAKAQKRADAKAANAPGKAKQAAKQAAGAQQPATPARTATDEQARGAGPSASRPPLPEVDSASLKQAVVKQQQALRKELRRRFLAVADTLQLGPALGHYYQRLWADGYAATYLENDYRQLANKLAASTLYSTSLPAYSPLYALDTLLQRRLAPTYSSYLLTFDSTRYSYSVRLQRTDPAKDLLLRYYALTYQHPDNRDVRTLDTARLRQLIRAGAAQQTTLAGAIQYLRPTSSLAALDQAYARHLAFRRYEHEAPLFRLLRAPWLKSWLWHYSELPLLNPLLFVDEGQVLPADTATLLALYRTRVERFNTYVDKTLESKPAGTRHFSIATYTDDVRQLGRGRELFTDTAAYRKARVANRAIAQSFRTTTVTLNEVILPKFRPHDHYVTVLDTRRNALATTTDLNALTTETRVVFSVHNLAAKHELKLARIQATPITDQSALQQAIAEGLDGLTLLKTTLGGLPASFLTSLTIPRLQPKETREKLEKGGWLLGKPAADTLAFRPRQSTHRITTQEFWAAAERTARRDANLLLTDETAHPFLTLLPPADRLFRPDLFARLKAELAATIAADLHSPLTDDQYKKLLQKVAEHYLLLHLQETAWLPVVQLVRDDNVFLANSLRIVRASSLPPPPPTPLTDEVAQYHSEQGVVSPSDSTRAYTYGLQDVSGGKATQFATYSYRTGKLHAFQLSAGLAYTFNPVTTPELSITNGQVSYSSTDTRFRVYGGMHLYPGRLFLQDNRFWGKFRQRINVLVAVGIPQPLENLYFGVGYDLGPGIKVSTGLHLHGYTRYEVSNNQLVGQAKVYQPVWPFVSLGIDPVSFVKAIVLFF